MATGPQDQPDFIRLSQSAAPLVLNVNQTATLTQTQSAWTYVGNATTLLASIALGPGVAYGTVWFQFANDSLGTAAGFSVRCSLDNTHPQKMIIPVAANWVRITSSSNAADGSGETASINIEGVTSIPRMATIVDNIDMILSSTLAVAANGIVNINLPRTTAGAWFASLNSTQSGVFLSVQQLPVAATWQSVGQVAAAAFQTSLQVYLAQFPTRLQVQNTSAAAADLFYTLIPGP